MAALSMAKSDQRIDKGLLSEKNIFGEIYNLIPEVLQFLPPILHLPRSLLHQNPRHQNRSTDTEEVPPASATTRDRTTCSQVSSAKGKDTSVIRLSTGI